MNCFGFCFGFCFDFLDLFGGLFWEEFLLCFSQLSYLNMKGIDLFVKILIFIKILVFVKILSQWRRKE